MYINGKVMSRRTCYQRQEVAVKKEIQEGKSDSSNTRKKKRDEKTPSGNAGKKPLLAPPEERVKVSSGGQAAVNTFWCLWS
jgi:hypothetical protein